jgi:hypothetical protein
MINIWSKILSWFKERSERNDFINQFNESAKNSFVSGQTDTFLKASVSIGNMNYRHAFSKTFAGGFRIKAEAGGLLTRDDVKAIGQIILNDQIVVRLMISLGWDTLEVYPSGTSSGMQWKLFNQLSIE